MKLDLRNRVALFFALGYVASRCRSRRWGFMARLTR